MMQVFFKKNENFMNFALFQSFNDLNTHYS